MIKQLITDLSYDQISLTQGLSRAKLIAFEIQNSDFKNWIVSELNGYQDENNLPDYRIISCDTFATMQTYNQKRTLPIDLTEIDKDLDGKIYNMRVRQSIANIEKAVVDAGKEQFGYDEFPQAVVANVRELFNNKFIVTVKRRVQFSQYSHILNLTKQKLIDMLLDLNANFPNLEDNFKNNEENKHKAQTIITNHIYGENANANIATGNNVSQKIKIGNEQKISELVAELKRIGIPKEEIAQVVEIVNTEPDKKQLGKKLMTWLGNMTTKAVEKGIDLQLPVLIEKISDLL